MREVNQELKGMLKRMMSKSVVTDQPVIPFPEEICFPLSTPEAMEAFDDQLGHQATNLSVVRIILVMFRDLQLL